MKIEDVDLETLKRVVSENKSKRQVLLYFGISSKNGNQNAKLDRIIKDNNIESSHFSRDKDFSIIDSIISTCVSYKDIGVRMGIAHDDKSMHASYYTKIRNYIESNNLDISHFNDGGRYHNAGIRYSLENIFVEKSEVSKQTLKKRYIKYRIENDIQVSCCDRCRISEWMGDPLSLQLDHINGTNDDNRIDNLRLICPNCHSQTETFAGKNRN
jgi:hypothetical protein